MDAPHLPCTWAGPEWPFFQINHYTRIGPLSAYNSDILAMDTNTGTQLDVPPHSIPPPDSNLPDAGPFGRIAIDGPTLQSHRPGDTRFRGGHIDEADRLAGVRSGGRCDR